MTVIPFTEHNEAPEGLSELLAPHTRSRKFKLDPDWDQYKINRRWNQSGTS